MTTITRDNSSCSFVAFNFPFRVFVMRTYRSSFSVCRLWLVALAIATTATALDPHPLLGADTRRPPNVLLIMADDLGFSDLGCYGSEIDTPNLDSLAASGLRYTQFYNTGRCWPTRGALMTGYYPQSIRRDAVPGVKSGGRGQRPDWAPLLCRPLKKAGYRCYHTGPWHIDGMRGRATWMSRL